MVPADDARKAAEDDDREVMASMLVEEDLGRVRDELAAVGATVASGGLETRRIVVEGVVRDGVLFELDGEALRGPVRSLVLWSVSDGVDATIWPLPVWGRVGRVAFDCG